MLQWADGHHIQLLHGGAEFFPALVAAIDQSLHEVRLETYIFNPDASGQRVAEALIAAARRGVAVYLVVDGAGTPGLPLDLLARFDDSGVQWHLFSPLAGLGWLMPSLWRRLHRKLCVVDGRVAFCGGINVLDDFVDPNFGVLEAARFDFSVRVTGPLVQDAVAAMTQFWWRLTAAKDFRGRAFGSAIGTVLTAARTVLKPSQPPSQETGLVVGDIKAGLVLRDNLRQRTQIERAYRQAIAQAKTDIIIANAYFLPGARLRRGLIHAARRGVKVQLLLQGRYEYFMQYHGARPIMGALLAAGIEIYEYAPSFLHAKVAVVDGQWATVGSSNLDPLSLLLAREANVVVLDKGFATNLKNVLVLAMQTQGKRLDPAIFANRPWRERLMDSVAYALMRVVLLLSGRRY